MYYYHLSFVFQLRAEKCKLEQTLEQEQECLVNKLMRKIEKLEAETEAKQTNLEQRKYSNNSFAFMLRFKYYYCVENTYRINLV